LKTPTSKPKRKPVSKSIKNIKKSKSRIDRELKKFNKISKKAVKNKNVSDEVKKLLLDDIAKTGISMKNRMKIVSAISKRLRI
jgi:hypothetical protein